MIETLPNPTPEAVRDTQRTLDECLELLRYEGCEVEVSDADKGYLKELGLDKLPKGIAIFGGAARAILLRSRYNEYAPIRDIDLIELVELSDGKANTRALSEKFMPDDYAYGHGVGKTTVDAYFATRDFTMNEVLVVNGKIISTTRAAEDIQTRTLCATEYETDRHGRIGPKLKMKALLLSAVFDVYDGKSQDCTQDSWSENPFYAMVTLNKAFQFGREVVERFMEHLGYKGTEDELYQAAIDEAVAYAKDDDFFSFRGSAIADEIMDYAWGESGRAPSAEADFDFGSNTDTMAHAVELLGAYRKHLARGVIEEY